MNNEHHGTLMQNSEGQSVESILHKNQISLGQLLKPVLLTADMCFREGDERPQFLTQEIADTMRIISSPFFLSFFPLIASNLLFDLLLKTR